jgi:hypothetical protein
VYHKHASSRPAIWSTITFQRYTSASVSQIVYPEVKSDMRTVLPYGSNCRNIPASRPVIKSILQGISLAIAIVAVNRQVPAWFKGYYDISPAFSAYGRKHLVSRPVVTCITVVDVGTIAVLPRFPCLAT